MLHDSNSEKSYTGNPTVKPSSLAPRKSDDVIVHN